MTITIALIEQIQSVLVEKTSLNLLQKAKTAMCAKRSHSRYCVASGCESPPLATKLENIKAVVDTTMKYGQIERG